MTWRSAFAIWRSRSTASASSVAEPAGIILADTKFEFGVDRATGELLLIDEVLTPDSSRFWDAATYEPGRSQASFDKQYVRDWLEGQPWDKTPPGPALPDDIVDGDAGPLRGGVRAHHRGELRALPRGGHDRPMSTDFRFAVNVTPKPGILDPQGRAVESSLGHLGIEGVSAVRVGRRIELTVAAADQAAAQAVVERLASELLSNPLIEAFDVEMLGAASSTVRGSRVSVRIGVVIFPGSNRDIDAVNALHVAGAEPVILWHEQASLEGVARGDPAGRLRVRRLPAGRVSSPGSAR